MDKKYGFTFAEVMITLVIIGIVSLLVVPALLDSSNQRLNAAAAKKAKYEMSQAAMLVQTECMRWRKCPIEDNPSAQIASHLRDTDEIQYRIKNYTDEIDFNGVDETGIKVIANVDGPVANADTDICYFITDKGALRELTGCRVEDYTSDAGTQVSESDGDDNNDCPPWPAAGDDWIPGAQ